MTNRIENIKKWLAEIAVIFIGITLAFFVDDYRSNRDERDILKKHLSAILKDLVQDSIRFRAYVETSKVRVRRLDSLSDIIQRTNGIKEKLLMTAYLQSFEFWGAHGDAFEAFKATGDFAKMNNLGLRDSLNGYYGSQAFLRSLHDSHYEWLVNNVFRFADMNLHPDDNKFDMYWAVDNPFGKWKDEPPHYKSNLKEFDEMLVLNYAKRCRYFHFYVGGAMEYGDLINNRRLIKSINRAIM